MVDFRPLEAFEYDPRAAGDLSTLIAAPYDVVSPMQRRALASGNPYNIVHITLPEPAGQVDKYAAAAHIVEQWKARRIIVPCKKAFYVIEQTFESDGKKLTRTGIMGQVLLGPWGTTGVFPHEVTLPKPKQDRLKLYRATKVVPGPSFSLFEDKGGAARGILAGVKATAPYRTADGPEGSFDRVWKITDPRLHKRIHEAVAGEQFFIADGHHRYETALAYRDELAAKGDLPPQHGANCVLMCAVPFDDPGLQVLPTHRLLRLDGAAAVSSALEALAAEYDSTPAASLEGFRHTGASAPADIAIYAAKAACLLRMKSAARAAFEKLVGGTLAGVNTVEVLNKVLPRFYGDPEEAVSDERVWYTHSVDEAVAAVDRGDFQAAVILKAVTVRQIAMVASTGRTMPPKSTYFYPKLPTGVVIKPLE